MRNLSMYNKSIQGDLSSITTYQAGVLQASMHRMIQQTCDKVLKPYGISKMHWLIIGTVLDSGKQGIRLTELSEELNTTMPYITTAVNILESKRMLTRKGNTADSRSKQILINKAFAPKCTKIEASLREALRKSIYAKIDPADFQIYMKVMLQLAT